LTKYPIGLSGKPLPGSDFATDGTTLDDHLLRRNMQNPDGLLQGVAILSALGHHEFVVPETELAPEFRKTGHRMADL
jgi:hypothetical protein